jgi:hypothetical protein
MTKNSDEYALTTPKEGVTSTRTKAANTILHTLPTIVPDLPFDGLGDGDLLR